MTPATDSERVRFLTERELAEIAERHDVVLFGAGYFADKTMNLLERDPIFLVDNHPGKQSSDFRGVEVKDPSYLKEYLPQNPEVFLVICVQKYSEVLEQLSGYGIDDSSRYAITPIAYELAVLEDIHSHDNRILFSNYDTEGGLYLFDFKTGETKELAHGSVRGFTRVRNDLFYVSLTGLYRLDAATFEEKEKIDFPEYDLCGLIYDEDENELIVADTERDAVVFVDPETLEIRRSFSFSEKFERFGRESHHVNDLVVKGDYVLASMFSVNGWWRYGLYDGGLIEIEKKTGEMRTIPIKDTWMPHSLRLHQDGFYLLDSMNGRVIKDMRHCLLELDGYLRGLEFYGRYMYIGQSLHRHVSRLKHRQSISANCGIHIYDTESKVRRFIEMPDKTNIYQIMNLTWDHSG